MASESLVYVIVMMTLIEIQMVGERTKFLIFSCGYLDVEMC